MRVCMGGGVSECVRMVKVTRLRDAELYDGPYPNWSPYGVRKQSERKRENSDHVKQTHATSPGAYRQVA